MPERDWIEPIVERVVTQVLESHTAQLRTEIVRRVMEEVALQPAPPPAAPPGADSAELARVVSGIQLGTSQKEILRALLDSCAQYAARVALFVVKGVHASGWQGRGFSRNDALKDFALDSNASAVVRAIGERTTVAASAPDNDRRFLAEFGAPANGEARFLPLLLKDKVAALVYADAGTDPAGQLDAGSLELLVLATGAWLEVTSLRKQAHKEHEAASDRTESRSMPPVQSVSAFNDPFAAHAPGHAMAAAASAEAPSAKMSAAVAEAEPPAAEAIAEPLPEVHAAAAVPAAEVPAAPAVSAEDQETHRKAQRFARLLVDEVKLYNQAKVTEGRQHKDLYDRLKEAIEKSRATYQKRYGNTVAASGDYFQHELIRSLAEDDVSIMGANFRH